MEHGRVRHKVPRPPGAHAPAHIVPGGPVRPSPRTVSAPPLPSELHTILSTRILPAFLSHAAPSARPRVLVVAGAPGSGKTAAADRLQPFMIPHAVRICADLLKAEHPAYAPALAADERHAGLVVRADTRRWAQELAARARLLGADMVEEIALDDPQALRLLSAAYRLAGYRIHLLVLDIPAAVGQLRITARHLQHARQFGAVRYVSAAHRTACADRLLDTLAVAESERLADRVIVLGHLGRVLYRNVLIGGIWAGPRGAAVAVATARRLMWADRVHAGFERAAAAVARELRDERLADHRRQTAAEDLETARLLAARQRPVPDAGEGFGCLPHGQRQRIFERDIVPVHLSGITTHDDPHAIYVVSQPGGNKSLRSRDILNQHSTRAPTLISSDFLKAAHPEYRRLLQHHPRTAGAIIRADYRFWRDQAEARVREQRGDVVIEMAPGTLEEFCSSVAGFATAGYRITVVVVAVRAADSRQATALRYLQQIRQNLPARFTTASGHDQCFTAVAACTALAVHDPAINTVKVVDRDGCSLSVGHRGITDNSTVGMAPAVLDAERSRRYTRFEAELFRGHQAELVARLPQYWAELDDIAAQAAPLMPPEMLPRASS
ncbi:zeta toxin family protein [Streptomyces europaeiscabiei]|uniref:zeta toxin family protein n=1 Tax=Streptomyces europaeiscabiei TaxID=146819 RepID=UPI00299F972F|nr:zeta toxin family protein [Streptomyces europaeiscabiei]MDX3589098.1 zeta toxin family protein [Streptomyces europaeiscabiei]